MREIDRTELRADVPADELIEALHDVYDPELGIDIVHLGLVYGVAVVGGDVQVTMTLTTPGCPMHGSIEEDVRATLGRRAGVDSVDVLVCWDPPWSPASMSDEAKRSLGWLA